MFESFLSFGMLSTSQIRKLHFFGIDRKTALRRLSSLRKGKWIKAMTHAERGEFGSLKLLSQSIRRVSEISDDLLIRSKTITEYKEFNLIESIEQIIEEKNSALSKNRKIKIEVNPCSVDTDRSSYTLRGEKSLFLRAISNVIQNSIDAVTDDGCIEISLKKSDRLIELIISDNGVGIPDNIISSLKTDPRSHNKPTGNGLGLRSTIDYLKSVGGRIDISSREGQGTSISLFHPSTSV